MTVPTRWKLAEALIVIGLYDMADRAVAGWYDDFLSPLDMPISALVNDLRAIGTPEALTIAVEATRGEYDATPEEADTWAASPQGREAFMSVMQASK